ncbi:MAG: S-layer homology domain-containing protein [Phascolarctobacterium sp.]|nr:S-layer homology domain-containing protein [Phascolarctobacterium sp.]
MKKSLVLAMAMALGVTASAYAANPFSDVPAGHWAYDSVAKLAAAGVVDGYADGAFDGDKLMTRYEMAQIVAKAMAKGANVDKLAAEFADELDTLGVRVAKLEKGADAVKITGNIRWHYSDVDTDGVKTSEQKLRSRIWIQGQVNDDWKYTAMLENNHEFSDDDIADKNGASEEDVKFQRAYVNGKLGGFAVQAGRYDNKIMDGNIYHSRFDGVQLDYGKDVKVRLVHGKATPSSLAKGEAGDVNYAEVSGKLGVVALTAGYYDVQDVKIDSQPIEDMDLWAVNASMPLAKDLKLGAVYVKSDNDSSAPYGDVKVDDDGYVATLSYKGAKASVPGSWGLEAKYYDMGATTYMDHTMNGGADKLAGFEGWGLFANYALAKNIVAQVEWYDLDSKENDVTKETLWTQVVFTF